MICFTPLSLWSSQCMVFELNVLETYFLEFLTTRSLDLINNYARGDTETSNIQSLKGNVG